MTGRGRNNPPPRPVSPMDPSLESNPVPKVQDMATYSIGPGAAPDAASSFSTMQELLEANELSCRTYGGFLHDVDRHSATLSEAEMTEEEEDQFSEQIQIRDRTWGFYVFVTDYGANSQASLPAALEKLLQCVHINLLHDVVKGYDELPVADEIWRRFRLEIVEDPEKLSNASLDRVRATFMALLRARRPDFGDRDISVPMGARFAACLLLDAEAIRAIAGLDVPDNYTEHVEAAYKQLDRPVLKAVCGEWERPETSYSTYRGWYPLSPMDFMHLWEMVGSGSHEMEDLYEREKNQAKLYGFRFDLVQS